MKWLNDTKVEWMTIKRSKQDLKYNKNFLAHDPHSSGIKTMLGPICSWALLVIAKGFENMHQISIQNFIHIYQIWGIAKTRRGQDKTKYLKYIVHKTSWTQPKREIWVLNRPLRSRWSATSAAPTACCWNLSVYTHDHKLLIGTTECSVYWPLKTLTARI